MSGQPSPSKPARPRRFPSRQVTVIVLGLALVLAVAAAAQSTPGFHDSGRLDLVSSAEPTDAAPSVTDRAFDVAFSSRNQVKANAVSTTSVLCDGCHGDARGIQIVFLDRPRRAEVDNVATAWSSCTGCDGSAVSVQIVFMRHGGDLIANNRSLAVNAACDTCATRAAAYQIVLVLPGRQAVPGAFRQQVKQWAARQAATLRRVHGDVPAKESDQLRQPALRQLSGMVTSRVGGRVVHRSVDVQVAPPKRAQ
jgi:hypothetical protein